jgi:hypothetical protein
VYTFTNKAKAQYHKEQSVMNNLGNDYASIMMYEARMQEMRQKAEQERKVRGLREEFGTQVRRILRINNSSSR